MFRELNEGLAYLTAIDFNDPGLRDHGAFRCPGAHAIFSVCMRVCVCARAPQAEGGVHRPGRYGGHPSHVCVHAGSVYVCVCTPVVCRAPRCIPCLHVPVFTKVSLMLVFLRRCMCGCGCPHRHMGLRGCVHLYPVDVCLMHTLVWV